MFKNKLVETLSKAEVFAGLTKDDLKTIAKHCKKIRFEKGDILIETDREPPGFFILISGQVRVVLPERVAGRKEKRASEIRLNMLAEGDCFGEYSLIEKTRTSAAVAGKEAGEVLKIPKEDFDQIMDDNKMAKIIYHNMLHILIKRLRKKESELDLVLLAS